MHARAQVEKGVKWINDKSEVEGEEAKEYWLLSLRSVVTQQSQYSLASSPSTSDLSFIHLTPFST
jgi:hypothetical protein